MRRKRIQAKPSIRKSLFFKWLKQNSGIPHWYAQMMEAHREERSHNSS
jgi:ribosomal protein L39E